ncbi:MAG TPA: large conductance mechanosensitive channel protein MscL [Patescibacteria group bacterium]|nr:large conductance mechanosensitive channel protein MscL [Patescibacteria group bacterium]
MIEGFKKFILRGNVVDLAVGIVVGAAFNSVVQSFVKDVFTPFLGIAGGIPDFSNLALHVGKATILLGDFINALISFLIVATAIYFFVVVPMNKLKDITNRSKGTEDPTTKKCPYCFSEISAKATRCPNCTSQLPKDKKK